MTNEIKEILDNMFHIIMNYEEDFEDLEENEIRYQLPYNKMQKLYDYITNLQEENKRLKENAEHNDKVVDKARWNEMIYKSRNEKAIEYIENHIVATETEDLLLNILKGEDK